MRELELKLKFTSIHLKISYYTLLSKRIYTQSWCLEIFQARIWYVLGEFILTITPSQTSSTCSTTPFSAHVFFLRKQ